MNLEEPTEPDALMLNEPENESEDGNSGQALHRGTATEITTDHSYIYAGGKLLREMITEGTNTKTLDFTYDNAGIPYSLTYNNGTATTTYYYITNLQGDVMYLVDANGNEVAAYDYDPYGKIISATGSMAEVNPLRYRGYYYDTETGFYYLQSRYYDPEICRFVSADASDVILAAPYEFWDKNLFAYCDNDPIQRADNGGAFWHIIVGAVVGAAAQYISDVATSLSEGKSFAESIKPTSTWADYGAAALSGALAATGVGIGASVALNAAISGTTYLANCSIKGVEANPLDFVLSTGIGAISGLIGGRGANGTKLRGIVKTSKAVLKTAVSSKKIAQYSAKIVACKVVAVVSASRTIGSVFASNFINNGRKGMTHSAV